MTTAQGQRTDKHISTEKTSKKNQLDEIGLTEKQAWQNEQLIKPENRQIVEKYLPLPIRIREAMVDNVRTQDSIETKRDRQQWRPFLIIQIVL